MDILTFKEFISIPVLISFYYFGAVVLPLFIWFFSKWLIKKFQFIGNARNEGKEILWGVLKTEQKAGLIIVFVMGFFFMELFWRMLFEFLIAYMQMRDALLL